MKNFVTTKPIATMTTIYHKQKIEALKMNIYLKKFVMIKQIVMMMKIVPKKIVTLKMNILMKSLLGRNRSSR